MKCRAPCVHSMCRSLTRNDATIIRTRLCIQPWPSSWRIPASTIGKPVRPAHHASNASEAGAGVGHLGQLRLEVGPRRVRPRVRSPRRRTRATRAPCGTSRRPASGRPASSAGGCSPTSGTPTCATCCRDRAGCARRRSGPARCGGTRARRPARPASPASGSCKPSGSDGSAGMSALSTSVCQSTRAGDVVSRLAPSVLRPHPVERREHLERLPVALGDTTRGHRIRRARCGRAARRRGRVRRLRRGGGRTG